MVFIWENIFSWPTKLFLPLLPNKKKVNLLAKVVLAKHIALDHIFPEQGRMPLLTQLAVFILMLLKFYLFLREREREETVCEWGRGRERGTQNPKQAPGSQLSAQSLMQGSNSRLVRSRPELKSMLNGLSHPGAPEKVILSKHGDRTHGQKELH